MYGSIYIKFKNNVRSQDRCYLWREGSSDQPVALGELLGAVNSLFLAHMVVTHVVTVIH